MCAQNKIQKKGLTILSFRCIMLIKSQKTGQEMACNLPLLGSFVLLLFSFSTCRMPWRKLKCFTFKRGEEVIFWGEKAFGIIQKPSFFEFI